MQTAAIILAAGAGTRMKSKKPKVAHEVLGRPLVLWVANSAFAAGASRVVTVVGHEKEQVIPLVEGKTEIVVQPERKGTADAVAVCKEALADFSGSLLVLSGDCPLITPETIARLASEREAADAAVALLTMKFDDPYGYGRILRNEAGEVQAIIEQKDANEEQTFIKECNAGFYCFDAQWVFDALTRIDNNNAQHEFYLTDVVKVAVGDGRKVVTVQTDNSHECLGVNSRVQLAQATKVAQQRINSIHMANGVGMLDPDQVWIGPEVKISQDVKLLPQVFLMGQTVIGEDSVIGPNTRLTNTVVGQGCHIDDTVAIGAQVEDGTELSRERLVID